MPETNDTRWWQVPAIGGALAAAAALAPRTPFASHWDIASVGAALGVALFVCWCVSRLRLARAPSRLARSLAVGTVVALVVVSRVSVDTAYSLAAAAQWACVLLASLVVAFNYDRAPREPIDDEGRARALPLLLLSLPGLVFLVAIYARFPTFTENDLSASLPILRHPMGLWYVGDAGRPGLVHRLFMLAGLAAGDSLRFLHACSLAFFSVVVVGLYRAYRAHWPRAVAFVAAAQFAWSWPLVVSIAQLRSWSTELALVSVAVALAARPSAEARPWHGPAIFALLGAAALDDPFQLAALGGFTAGVLLPACMRWRALASQLRTRGWLVVAAALFIGLGAYRLVGTMEVHTTLGAFQDESRQASIPRLPILYLLSLPFGGSRRYARLHGMAAVLSIATLLFVLVGPANPGADKLMLAIRVPLCVALSASARTLFDRHAADFVASLSARWRRLGLGLVALVLVSTLSALARHAADRFEMMAVTERLATRARQRGVPLIVPQQYESWERSLRPSTRTMRIGRDRSPGPRDCGDAVVRWVATTRDAPPNRARCGACVAVPLDVPRGRYEGLWRCEFETHRPMHDPAAAPPVLPPPR